MEQRPAILNNHQHMHLYGTHAIMHIYDKMRERIV